MPVRRRGHRRCYTLLNVDSDTEWRDHSVHNLLPIACVLGDSQMLLHFLEAHVSKKIIDHFC